VENGREHTRRREAPVRRHAGYQGVPRPLPLHWKRLAALADEEVSAADVGDLCGGVIAAFYVAQSTLSPQPFAESYRRRKLDPRAIRFRYLTCLARGIIPLLCDQPPPL